jgi:hypothetical protein
VASVQPCSLDCCDEKLAAVGVGACVGHGQVARALVLQLEVLVLQQQQQQCKVGAVGVRLVPKVCNISQSLKEPWAAGALVASVTLVSSHFRPQQSSIKSQCGVVL